MLKNFITALLCTVAGLSTAQAHVTLEQQSAIAGSTYKGIFRVGHGCEGSPTTSVTVFLPAGFIGAKAMPKAGWKLDIKTEAIEKQVDGHGTPMTERAAQFTWSGGRLLDTEYDEFIIRTPLPRTPGKQWIRVLQQCEKGQNDWAAIPVADQARPKFPAATLEITPAAVAPHHH